MRPPTYLSNLVMAVSDLTIKQASELAIQLEKIVGVIEAVVIIEENEVYLKVDNKILDNKALEQLLPS